MKLPMLMSTSVSFSPLAVGGAANSLIFFSSVRLIGFWSVVVESKSSGEGLGDVLAKNTSSRLVARMYIRVCHSSYNDYHRVSIF
jgi:hypothetical protein